MRILAQSLVLSALVLAPAVPAALAAPLFTVTCTDSSDGVTFTANGYQLYVDTSKDFSSFYFALHTNLSKYNEALTDEYFLASPFDSCVASPTNGTVPEDLTISDVAAVISGQSTYTLITFTFKALSVGPESSGRKMFASASPLSKEDKAKELAAFKATIPPLVEAKK